MSPNEKRARLVMDLVKLGSGAGVIEKTNAAGAIAALLVPDTVPEPVGGFGLSPVFGPEDAVPRAKFDDLRVELERVRALLIEAKMAQVPIFVTPEDAIPRAIFENTHGKLREKINDLQIEVASLKELRDAHSAQIMALREQRDAHDAEIVESRTKIAELTTAVEYRDRRIAEITHEKNELIKERDAARERAEGWKDMHAEARGKLENIEAVINGNAVVRSVDEEASE